MSMIVIATNACDNGPCPTFHKALGGVVVQGYKTDDPDHTPPDMPAHEGVLFIPDADWNQLIVEYLRYREQSVPAQSALR
ncbi:MAG: hypothetical protein ACRDS0_25670 [Pseudonocardiaceae bacterium]